MSPTGFEPVAPRLGISCSILLSYGDSQTLIQISGPQFQPKMLVDMRRASLKSGDLNSQRETIMATYETLVAQASKTASEYLREAAASIDEMFGEGYSKEHPELVGAFMQTAALDFLAMKSDGHPST